MIRILLVETEEALRILLSAQHLTRRRVSSLEEKDFPVLTYGPSSPETAGTPRMESPGIAAEEFDLKRIKGKIRELLGRSSHHSTASGAANSRRPPIPWAQMHFAFPWSGG